MAINVREAVETTTSAKLAMDRLKDMLDVKNQVQSIVNAVDSRFVEDQWFDDYDQMIQAIDKCVKAEKEIILDA